MITLMSHVTGVRFAEVGFLLIVIAGVWLVASELPAMKWAKARSIGAGLLLAAGGVLLIIATHYGEFS